MRLHSQLALGSLTLLGLPVLALVSAHEIEAFLVSSEAERVSVAAQALALTLSDRPSLFATDSPNTREAVRVDTIPDTTAIALDGDASDWDLAHVSRIPWTDGLFFRIVRQGRSVHFLFEVTDDDVVRASSDRVSAHAADGVEMALVTADDEFLRFVIQEAGDGAAQVSLVGDDDRLTPDLRLSAVFVETDDGYRIEARGPRSLAGSAIGLARHNVGAQDTGNTTPHGLPEALTDRNLLRPLFGASPEIATLVAASGLRARVSVVDAQGRLLARTGALYERSRTSQGGVVSYLIALLQPLYRSVTQTAPEGTTGSTTSNLPGNAEVRTRAQTAPATWRTRIAATDTLILSAAHPVRLGERTIGAVVVEETADFALETRDRVFQTLFRTLGVVVTLCVAGLLTFTWTLSNRVRRLKKAVDDAVDSQGRVRASVPSSTTRDEIGDVSRALSSLVARQKEYTGYLEALRSRLSHEVRTPVAVVRSSLDNLRLHKLPEDADPFLKRADQGLARLVAIVNRMTEASRLDEAVATTRAETFDMAALIRSCAEGYVAAHGDTRVISVIPSEVLSVSGSSDLVAQLLDKLVDNALDFASPGTPVEISLRRGLGFALLSVANDGPLPPPSLRAGDDGSSTAVRPQSNEKVHLGLGLNIVRTIAAFHQATVTVTPRNTTQGAVFTVAFPLVS